jgi:DNA-binding CsgD family transcriptional regulator
VSGAKSLLRGTSKPQVPAQICVSGGVGGKRSHSLASQPVRLRAAPWPAPVAAEPEFPPDDVETAAFLLEGADRFLAVNECACRLLGWTRAELLAQRPADVLLVAQLVPRGEAAVDTGLARLQRRDGGTVSVRYEARSVALDPALAALWLVYPVDDTAERPKSPALTRRELEILQLLSDGADTEEISRSLGIGPETIKTHIRRLLPKLQARSRTHAVAIALRRALVV